MTDRLRRCSIHGPLYGALDGSCSACAGSSAQQGATSAVIGTDAEPYKIRDTGQRREFGTGSVRNKREGKGRYDLIPAYPLERLAKHFEAGAKLYDDNNWQLGQHLGNYFDSAFRHLMNFKDGDRVEDHLTAVVWNVFAFIWTEREINEGRLPKELDDWSNRAETKRTAVGAATTAPQGAKDVK